MLTIVSGGQTGVDRAALDVALALGIPYTGWCPQGGWAEDMPDPPGVLAIYPDLKETPLGDPRQRTEWNVRDSDALLVLTDALGPSASEGTGFAVDCAERRGKPYLVVNVDAHDAVASAVAWVAARGEGARLCIGGPRASEAPCISLKAASFLRALLRPFAAGG